MKIMTIMGTRPEIIRLCRVIALLDEVCDHRLVFTGQNFESNLSDIFFRDLDVRRPNYNLNCRGQSAMELIGQILTETEKVLSEERPDRLLLLGDTNSALAAIPAKRLGIPVYHMEAGNRCYDDRVPEEVNRRIIDHSSDVLLPYTDRSRDHLLREGFHPNRIYVTGNPIFEVLEHYSPQIEASNILEEIGVTRGEFFLVTLHRSENVDIPERLESFLKAFSKVYEKWGCPIVISAHPRTRSRMKATSIGKFKGVRFIDPPGFFDFVRMEKDAKAVLSDSGTVQEEGCLFGVPTVTLRDVTERPETIEVGSNILTGAEPEDIIRCLNLVLSNKTPWVPPTEYLEPSVSRTVVKILLGHRKFS